QRGVQGITSSSNKTVFSRTNIPSSPSTAHSALLTFILRSRATFNIHIALPRLASRRIRRLSPPFDGRRVSQTRPQTYSLITSRPVSSQFAQWPLALRACPRLLRFRLFYCTVDCQWTASPENGHRILANLPYHPTHGRRFPPPPTESDHGSDTPPHPSGGRVRLPDTEDHQHDHFEHQSQHRRRSRVRTRVTTCRHKYQPCGKHRP
ncbi:hypothetical protein F5X68DRAFT_259392, partial [Plectosphaerella plurivora]